jgi:hypothetical protein
MRTTAELGMAHHLHISIQGYCDAYISLLVMIKNAGCVFPFGQDMKRVLSTLHGSLVRFTVSRMLI